MFAFCCIASQRRVVCGRGSFRQRLVYALARRKVQHRWVLFASLGSKGGDFLSMRQNRRSKPPEKANVSAAPKGPRRNGHRRSHSWRSVGQHELARKARDDGLRTKETPVRGPVFLVQTTGPHVTNLPKARRRKSEWNGAGSRGVGSVMTMESQASKRREDEKTTTHWRPRQCMPQVPS